MSKIEDELVWTFIDFTRQIVIEEPISHAYEQAKLIDVGISVKDKSTPRKIISKERWENINTFHIVKLSED